MGQENFGLVGRRWFGQKEEEGRGKVVWEGGVGWEKAGWVGRRCDGLGEGSMGWEKVGWVGRR